MNKLQKHPDLETSKAINHLFPDSEMVYVELPDRSARVVRRESKEFFAYVFICNTPNLLELQVAKTIGVIMATEKDKAALALAIKQIIEEK